VAWSTPAAWVAGIPTVAQLNARIRDQFNALGDPWTAYTPAWTGTTTNPVIGNGTITGSYRQIGKTIDYGIHIVMGTTTTYGTGNYRFSLPFASLALTAFTPLGVKGVCIDTSLTARNFRNAFYASTTTIGLCDDAAVQVTPTVPFTFANTDEIHIYGTYESA
jgi:hypothetical protein